MITALIVAIGAAIVLPLIEKFLDL